MLKRLFFLSALIGLFILTVAAAPASAADAAAATGPATAISPDGQTRTVAANTAQWYAFTLGGKKEPVTATLDAGSSNGLGLAIYTPEEISAWQNGNGLKSIGVGGAVQNHTLGWSGNFNEAGTYYAVVYNDNGAPMNAALTVSGDSVTLGLPPVAPSNPTGAIVTTAVTGANALTGKLMFVDAPGGNLYTANGDGTDLKQIASGVLDPQWSHAGTKIAYASQGATPGIYVMNADGSNVTLLYQTNEARSPSWSPDDSQIVFSFLANTKGGKTQSFSFRGHSFSFTTPETDEWRLALVNSTGGGYEDLPATNDALTPTWNANGNVIAFNDLNIGIMQLALNGEYNAYPFIGDLRNTQPDYNPLRLMSPQYSPDGSQVIYVVQQQPTWQIALANADGSNQHLLTSNDVLADTHPNNVAPVWSPDGKSVLFLSNRDGKWEFFQMNIDGTNVHQVLQNVTNKITLNYTYNSDHILSWTK